MKMRNHFISILFFALQCLLSLQNSATTTLPLSTNSRWIVDEHGQRVKLACVNWATHLQVVVAEGLSKQPVDAIGKRIKSMGFNCVRLTWATYLVTNNTLGSLTVNESFSNFGLVEAIAGFTANNPSFLNLTLIDALQAVVTSLGENNVMVILDNQVSMPMWCCGKTDGNGFFGDKYFDPKLWVIGLTKMATLMRASPNVVAMSLRNELRGPRQNIDDWYRYMQQGAEAIHSANPNVLVLFSGLSFDNDLSFLGNRPLNLTFTKKHIFEFHWYGFSDGEAWKNGNANQVCGQVVNSIKKRAAFLLDQGHPLFVSEFGADLRGGNVNDNRYLNCFMGWAAENDVDWAIWTLMGSYYLREGIIGLNEVYGVLDWSWCGVRNETMSQRIASIQAPFQVGPGQNEATMRKIIYHPLTGLCIQKRSLFGPLSLGPCREAMPWTSTPEKTLTLEDTYFCLRANKKGHLAELSFFCRDKSTKWEAISDSKMHLSSKLPNGGTVCLDVNPKNNLIVTNPCKCLSGDTKCEPASQWFKIISSSHR